MKVMKSVRSLVSQMRSFLIVGTLLTVGAATGFSQADSRGKQLYVNCTICHQADGGGSALLEAPAINNLSEKYIVEQLKKFKAGIRGGHPDDIAGLRMLPMAQTMVTEEDMQAVAAYVASLPSSSKEPTIEGGDATKGQAAYAVCIACHQANGIGNDLLNSPSLIHQYDWYQLAQLKKFKSGVRGADPRDITGAQMRPMTMTLVDEQAMKDVVAYIQTLSQ